MPATKVTPYQKGNPRSEEILKIKELKQPAFGTEFQTLDQDYFKFRQEKCPDQ
jgi:hypothetical protein